MASTLTATAVLKAPPKSKTYTLSDSNGLYLQVTTSGTKSWIFRYVFDNKQKKKSLGQYPAVTLADARKKRDIAKSTLANTNEDPFAKKVHLKVHLKHFDDLEWHRVFLNYTHKRIDAKAITDKKVAEKSAKEVVKLSAELFTANTTLKQWADWYILEMDLVHNLSSSHINRTRKGFKKDLFPAVGDKNMNDVTTQEIADILKSMSYRGSTESARKLYSSIKIFYRSVITSFSSLVENNPTYSIQVSKLIGKKETVSYPKITDPKELGVLLNAMSEYGLGEQEGNQTLRGHSSTRLALMMLANVFTRPSNVRLAEWDEIDLEAKLWTIPSRKMKTKKELLVPLSKQVLLILEEAKEASPHSKLVFPSNRSITSAFSDAAMVSEGVEIYSLGCNFSTNLK